MAHSWQQYSETCLKCGFNAYDPACPKVCPGNHDAYNAEHEAKKAKREAAEAEWNRWPDM